MNQTVRGVTGDWVDALFGFDFFISYGRADATAYAERLRDKLKGEKLRCFLDTEDFFPGQELDVATRRSVHKSSALVLVATEAAARSPHVRKELQTFSALDRPIVVVNVDDALRRHFPEEVRKMLSGRLWIDEAPDGPPLEPTDHVVRELCRHVRFTRQVVRRMRIFAAVAVLLAVLACAATYAAYLARARAQLALSRQLVAQARNHLSTQPDLALLLGAEAYAVKPTIEATAGVSEALGQLAQLIGHEHAFQSAVEKIAYSPDGRYFAALAPNESLVIWDVERRRKVATLAEPSGNFISFAFSADSAQLATCGSTGVAVWNIRTPDRPEASVAFPNAVRIAFSPDRRLLLAGTGDGHICLIDFGTGDIQDLGEAHRGFITAIVPDFAHGRFFTAGMSATRNIAVWDLRTFRREHFFESHRMSVNALALSGDGQHLASAGEDRTVIVWDAATGKEKVRFSPQANSVWTYAAPEPRGSGALALVFSSDDRELLAGYDDGRVIVWNLKTGKGGEIRAHLGATFALAQQSGAGRFASGGADGKLRFWDLAQAHPMTRLLAPDAGSRFLDMLPDGTAVLAVEGGRIRSWSTASGEELPPVELNIPNSPRVVAFSAAAGRAVFVDDEGTERGLVMRSGPAFRQTNVLSDARPERGKIALSPCGRYLAGATADAPLVVWDLRKERLKAVACQGAVGEVAAVAFSPDGSWLIAGMREGAVGIWNSSSGKLITKIAELPGSGSPTSVAGHSGAKIVAAGYLQDGAIACWHIPEPRHPDLLALTHGHALRSTINALAFDSQGTRLLSLSSQDDAVLWQMPAVSPLVRWPEFGDGYSRNLPLNAAGSMAASWGRGGILLHDLSIPHWVSRARNLAGRTLREDERRAFLNSAK